MIADAHHDLLHDLHFREHEPDPFAQHWLPQLSAGGVRLQVCAMASEDRMYPGGGLVQILRQAAAFHRACRNNPDSVAMVRDAADLDSALESGRTGLMLALEGVDAAGRHLGVVDALVDLGVRMVGLTWQFRNDAADGTGETEHGGLSVFGRQLVARLLERGVILDVAHASQGTFEEVRKMVGDAGGDILCSHGGCRALHDIPRNLTDDQLRALAAAGGVMGIAAVPPMLDENRYDLGVMVDHILHAVEVMGDQHVCLGGDFFAQLFRSMPGVVTGMASMGGGDTAPAALAGLEGPEQYQALVAALHETDLTEDQIDGILHANLIRFLGNALP